MVENVEDARGELLPAFPVGTVDFSDERLEHRRPGRYFGDLDARLMLARNGQQAQADAFGDFVAGKAPFTLRLEVNLNVGDIRSAPEIIVPHEAVEVVRRRRAGVGLDIDDLGLLERLLGKLAGHRARSPRA